MRQRDRRCSEVQTERHIYVQAARETDVQTDLKTDVWTYVDTQLQTDVQIDMIEGKHKLVEWTERSSRTRETAGSILGHAILMALKWYWLFPR